MNDVTSTDDNSFECPHCEQRLDVPKKLVGEPVSCPGCNRSITVTDSSSLSSTAPEVPKASISPVLSVRPWFLIRKNQKKKGPYSLKELKEVLSLCENREGLSIRNRKDRRWLPVLLAGALYPELVDAGVVELPDDPESVLSTYGDRIDKSGNPLSKREMGVCPKCKKGIVTRRKLSLSARWPYWLGEVIVYLLGLGALLWLLYWLLPDNNWKALPFVIGFFAALRFLAIDLWEMGKSDYRICADCGWHQRVKEAKRR